MFERGQGFTFVDDAGRTFTCRVEGSRPRAGDAWWWFDVSTAREERHAPCRAEPTDTAAAVKARVVAYYDELLARRAAPSPGRWHQRPRPGAARPVTAEPATGS